MRSVLPQAPSRIQRAAHAPPPVTRERAEEPQHMPKLSERADIDSATVKAQRATRRPPPEPDQRATGDRHPYGRRDAVAGTAPAAQERAEHMEPTGGYERAASCSSQQAASSESPDSPQRAVQTPSPDDMERADAVEFSEETQRAERSEAADEAERATKKRLIECDRHGRQRAYVACKHVAYRQRPYHALEHPTDESVGTIVCTACDAALLGTRAARGRCIREQLVTICARCALAIIAAAGRGGEA